MVSSSHKAAHRIFQDDPELLAPVFRTLGVPLPEGQVVEVLTPDVTEVHPVERRVDSVLRIRPPTGAGGFLLAIEAQGRRDREKAVSWAYYLSFLKSKYRCPALLLVVCNDKRTADWATGPFRLGPDGWTALAVHPLVLGPGTLPVILDPEEAARNLSFATLAAMTHGRAPEAPAILEALARALGGSGLDRAVIEYYSGLLEVGLGGSQARENWRNLMDTGTFFPGRGTLAEEKFLEGEAKGDAKGQVKGEARGRAAMILEILENRGIPVTPAARDRITGCTDLDTVTRWSHRVFTVTRADDLFEDHPAQQVNGT